MALTRGFVEADRLDQPRTTSDLTELHTGLIRLFDRGLAGVVSYNNTHSQWTFASTQAEADTLRLINTFRATGFLPYNLGYHGLTAANMTAPQLITVLAHIFRGEEHPHLDIRRTSPTTITYTTRGRSITGDTSAGFLDEPREDTAIAWATGEVMEDWEARTKFAFDTNHDDGQTGRPQLPESVLAATLGALVDRHAPVLFGESALTIDLNTWAIRRHGEGPATFFEALPFDVQQACALLAAPPLQTRDEFVAWAEVGLTHTFACANALPDHDPETGAGGSGSRLPGKTPKVRHTVRVDPHTGRISDLHVGATRQQADLVAGVHLLRSLADYPPKCALAETAWQGSGEVPSGTSEPFTHVSASRVLAIHWVARAVQHLDEALEPGMFSTRFGFSPRHTRSLLAHRGPSGVLVPQSENPVIGAATKLRAQTLGTWKSTRTVKPVVQGFIQSWTER